MKDQGGSKLKRVKERERERERERETPFFCIYAEYERRKGISLKCEKYIGMVILLRHQTIQTKISSTISSYVLAMTLNTIPYTYYNKLKYNVCIVYYVTA